MQAEEQINGKNCSRGVLEVDLEVIILGHKKIYLDVCRLHGQAGSL